MKKFKRLKRGLAPSYYLDLTECLSQIMPLIIARTKKMGITLVYSAQPNVLVLFSRSALIRLVNTLIDSLINNLIFNNLIFNNQIFSNQVFDNQVFDNQVFDNQIFSNQVFDNQKFLGGQDNQKLFNTQDRQKFLGTQQRQGFLGGQSCKKGTGEIFISISSAPKTLVAECFNTKIVTYFK